MKIPGQRGLGCLVGSHLRKLIGGSVALSRTCYFVSSVCGARGWLKYGSVGGRSAREGRGHRWVVDPPPQFPVLFAGSGQLGSRLGLSGKCSSQGRESREDEGT